jgi:hypothetical protein
LRKTLHLCFNIFIRLPGTWPEGGHL